MGPALGHHQREADVHARKDSRPAARIPQPSTAGQTSQCVSRQASSFLVQTIRRHDHAEVTAFAKTWPTGPDAYPHLAAEATLQRYVGTEGIPAAEPILLGPPPKRSALAAKRGKDAVKRSKPPVKRSKTVKRKEGLRARR